MNANDIELLHAEGYITDAQRDELAMRFLAKPVKEMTPPQRSLVYFLAVVAAILIVCGAIVLAVSHWNAITPLMKMLAGMALMALAWVGHYALRTKKPFVAEGLGLLGAGMWGANIVLNSALFDLQNPAVNGWFLIFIGVLPIPFLVRQRVLIGLVAICSVILYSSMLDTPASASPLSLEHIVQLPGTVISIHISLLLIWWMVGEKCREIQGVCKGYYWITFPAFIIFMVIIQFLELYSTPPMHTMEHNWLIYAVTALFIPILKPKSISWVHWCAATLSSLALCPLAIHLSWHTAYREVLGMLIFTAYSGALMALSIRSKRMSWLYYSFLALVFIFIDLLVRIGHSLSDSGLFLMAMGGAVLVFAYVLEKQRRYLVGKLKNSNNLPPVTKA